MARGGNCAAETPDRAAAVALECGGALRLLDAAETLAGFMVEHARAGALAHDDHAGDRAGVRRTAGVRVRAYGEMVDVQ